MTARRIITYSIIYLITTSNLPLAAQVFDMTLTTELQTDFQGGYNWVNLFRTDFQWAIARQIHLNAATISTVKTREKRLANDLQTFSNIEEENIPLAIAVLGLDWQVGNSTLFMGIRNLNEDYFTSACTSLFTNSSCGIFPTLSANYPIANYPVASVGIDYKLLLENWLFETSLYNGTGYRDFTGKENVFRFCPKTDGILSVTSINYRKYGNEYYLGIALHYGLPVGHEMGTENKETEKKEQNTIVWGYAEQRLTHNLHLLAQYSINPTERTGCRRYAGIGLIISAGKTRIGLFADHACFKDNQEWAGELTCKIPCLRNGYLQPTLHMIHNNQERKAIGLLRLGYTL